MTSMGLACESAQAGHVDGRAMGAIHDWATPENLQPEPITVEIWRELPEEFCRQVEVVNGQAVRCEALRRTHQAAARRLATVFDSAVADYVALHPGSCLDVSNDFDVILWEVPAATIRRPDLALHNCAPDVVRPLPASYIRVIVEVVSPGSDKTDRVEKMGSMPMRASPSTGWCGSRITGWHQSMSTCSITRWGPTGCCEPSGQKTS